jgi:hypothetical protein
MDQHAGSRFFKSWQMTHNTMSQRTDSKSQTSGTSGWNIFSGLILFAAKRWHVAILAIPKFRHL